VQHLNTEQKVCEIGGVKFGGQPGEHPSVCCFSIFQENDRLFEGKRRKKGFNQAKAEEILKKSEKLSQDTGVSVMADIVASPGETFDKYVDFVTQTSSMPFCIDSINIAEKIQGAKYCAEKGLLDRMFYNSLTVWEQDIEREIKEISEIGIKHVLLVTFDMEDQMPTGRITGAQKLLDAIEKAGAEFETIFVDTSVMNAPAAAFCSVANRLIKEKWGFACASAPSNASYMELKRFKDEMWDFKAWSGVDSALEALSAFWYNDLIFSGPIAGAGRVIPSVATADAFCAASVFAETKKLPQNSEHPLFKLFPDFAKQLKALAG
jgi:tetrahydromethanopterin S-methyltransferase subunit H